MCNKNILLVSDHRTKITMGRKDKWAQWKDAGTLNGEPGAYYTPKTYKHSHSNNPMLPQFKKRIH